MKHWRKYAIFASVAAVATIGVVASTHTNKQEPAPQGQTLTSVTYVKLGPPDIYPPVSGVTNPDITQENINQTICNPKWSTKSIRPPVTYTNKLKLEQIQEFGLQDANPADYEEDHLISLELGGSPTDPQNLWPELYHASIPDGGAKTKDLIENDLHKKVCSGIFTLSHAQSIIVTDWYAYYKGLLVK